MLATELRKLAVTICARGEVADEEHHGGEGATYPLVFSPSSSLFS